MANYTKRIGLRIQGADGNFLSYTIAGTYFINGVAVGDNSGGSTYTDGSFFPIDMDGSVTSYRINSINQDVPIPQFSANITVSYGPPVPIPSTPSTTSTTSTGICQVTIGYRYVSISDAQLIDLGFKVSTISDKLGWEFTGANNTGSQLNLFFKKKGTPVIPIAAIIALVMIVIIGIFVTMIVIRYTDMKKEELDTEKAEAQAALDGIKGNNDLASAILNSDLSNEDKATLIGQIQGTSSTLAQGLNTAINSTIASDNIFGNLQNILLIGVAGMIIINMTSRK